MSDPLFSLTGSELAELRRIMGYNESDGPQWSRSYLAYEYLSYIVNEREARTGVDIDDGFETWLEKASEINRNDPLSAANIFIRQVTRAGLQLNEKANEPLEIQNTSDRIGQVVLGNILTNGEVGQLREILGKDVQAAIADGNQNIAGWGGSLNYWNLSVKIGDETKSIGEHITGDPELWEQFIAINASALDATLKSELMDQPCNEVEFGQFFRFGLGGDAPYWVRTQILERAISRGRGDSYLSDPNFIFHPETHHNYIYNDANGSWLDLTNSIGGVSDIFPDENTQKYLNEARTYIIENQERAIFFPDRANDNVKNRVRRKSYPKNWQSRYNSNSFGDTSFIDTDHRLGKVEDHLEEINKALGISEPSAFDEIGRFATGSVIDFASGKYSDYKNPLRAALVGFGNDVLGAWFDGDIPSLPAPPIGLATAARASQSAGGYARSQAQLAQNIAKTISQAARFL